MDFQTPAKTQRVKFLIMSDTHDLLPNPDTAFQVPGTEIDVVLHCVDLTEQRIY